MEWGEYGEFDPKQGHLSLVTMPNAMLKEGIYFLSAFVRQMTRNDTDSMMVLLPDGETGMLDREDVSNMVIDMRKELIIRERVEKGYYDTATDFDGDL